MVECIFFRLIDSLILKTCTRVGVPDCDPAWLAADGRGGPAATGVDGGEEATTGFGDSQGASGAGVFQHQVPSEPDLTRRAFRCVRRSGGPVTAQLE